MTKPPRIPVHVVYGGAHLFHADTARRLGSLALTALRTYAATPAALARALRLPGTRTAELYRRLTEKLQREPVEDYRIDFEDGFGRRSDDEEDRYARSTAEETAAGLAAGSLPPMMGIRIKPLAPGSRGRAFRTLELYFSTLAAATSGRIPEHLAVTLPKLTDPGQVAACGDLLGRLEEKLNLSARVNIELMVETPQVLMSEAGVCPLRSFIAAGGGRVVAVHFGPYDYTAALGIAGTEQRLDHPACDAARNMIQLACAGTGVRISDGPVNILPIPPHRSEKHLGATKVRENRAAMHDLWRRNYELVRRALGQGYYQGWDLHPSQLPVRFAAVYAFFLEQLESQARRLRSYAAQPAQTSVIESVFDDAATAEGLMIFFRRGISCGALTTEDLADAGVDMPDLSAQASDQQRARS